MLSFLGELDDQQREAVAEVIGGALEHNTFAAGSRYLGELWLRDAETTAWHVLLASRRTHETEEDRERFFEAWGNRLSGVAAQQPSLSWVGCTPSSDVPLPLTAASSVVQREPPLDKHVRRRGEICRRGAVRESVVRRSPRCLRGLSSLVRRPRIQPKPLGSAAGRPVPGSRAGGHQVSDGRTPSHSLGRRESSPEAGPRMAHTHWSALGYGRERVSSLHAAGVLRRPEHPF